jgi:hypothetical protein
MTIPIEDVILSYRNVSEAAHGGNIPVLLKDQQTLIQDMATVIWYMAGLLSEMNEKGVLE